MMEALSFPDIICKSLYADKHKPWRFELQQDVMVELSNGDTIIIPAGYVTDFATVPVIFRGVVHLIGNHNLATLIHDWLYDNQYSITEGKNSKRDRLFADQEMLYWLRKARVNLIKRMLMYYACRIGGIWWWYKK